jgi:hypothetical protein
MSSMTQPIHPPFSWRRSLQAFQSLQDIHDHPCAELTVIFQCGHRLENLRGCRLCLAAHEFATQQPCGQFNAQVLYPQEICQNCQHECIYRERSEDEDRRRRRRREDREREERRKEEMKRRLNNAGWKKENSKFL